MKIQKRNGVILYGDPDKFQTYEAPGHTIQIRDNRQTRCGRGMQGIVAVLPTLGGQFATWQTGKEAKSLARKIVRLLNA